jgi:hypothetical protein
MKKALPSKVAAEPADDGTVDDHGSIRTISRPHYSEEIARSMSCPAEPAGREAKARRTLLRVNDADEKT